MMLIRSARAEDVAAVLPMVEKISALHEKWDPAKYPFLPDIPGMYDEWLRRMSKNPRGVFLVAERAEKVWAYLLTCRRPGAFGNRAEVVSLAVDPAVRGRGVASALMKSCLRRLRLRGISRLALMVIFALSCFGILTFLWVSFGGSVPLAER